MFSLLHGFWNYLFAKTELHILILGLDMAGKTTLLEQMKGIFNHPQPGIPPERIPPTIGLNIAKMNVDKCRVIFWDLGGQVRMRSIWEKYYAEAHGMIFVVDSADVGRFEEAKLAFDAVRHHDDLGGVPVMLLANKQDLAGALMEEDIAMRFQLPEHEHARHHMFRLQPASCLTCEGIEDGIRWIVEEGRVSARMFER